MFIQPDLVSATNDHLHQLSNQLGPPPSRPLSPGLDVDYIFLCFTNRTGSNMLGQMLASTGACNAAGEFFNWDIVMDTVRGHQLADFTAYFEHVVAQDAVDGRIVMKAGLSQLALLAAYGILERILPRSRFVLIQRQDKVAQVVSWVIASQTQRWTSQHAARIPEQELTYQFGWLQSDLFGLLQSEAEMAKFLACNAITPLHVSYESLAADPVGVTQRLLNDLELGHLRPDAARLTLRRQSSPIKSLWRDRFAADLRAV